MEKPVIAQPSPEESSVAKSPKSNRIQIPKKVYILLLGMNGNVVRIDLNVYDDVCTNNKPVWVTLTVPALITLLSDHMHLNKMTEKLQQDSFDTRDGSSAGNAKMKFNVPIPLQLLEILRLDEKGEMSAVPQDALAKTCVSFFVGDDLEEDSVQAGEGDPRYRLIVFDDDDNVAEIREVDEAAKNDLIPHFLVKNDEELAAKNDFELHSLYAFERYEIRRLLILYHVVDARFFLGVLRQNPLRVRCDTQLHFATKMRYVTEVACLLGAAIDVNVKDREGKTALHLASVGAWKKAHLEIVNALLSAGADFEATDRLGQTALHKCREPEIATCLIDAGADVLARACCGGTVLHLSAGVEMLNYWIATGADVNAKNNDGDTALHSTCCSGDQWLKLVKILVEAGIDVNAHGRKGRTALHAWVNFTFVSFEIVKYLIDVGAHVHSKDEDGETALHFAATASIRPKMQIKIVDFLIKAGAEIHVRNNKGETPLHSCAKLESGPSHLSLGRQMQVEKRFEMAKYLISNGADINAESYEGLTPLCVFCGNYSISDRENTEIVEWLLSEGADINAGTVSALHTATDSRNYKAVSLLTQAGADVNAKDDVGNSLLHKAVNLNPQRLQDGHFWCDEDYIRMDLVNAGANINAMDMDFQTPLDRTVAKFLEVSTPQLQRLKATTSMLEFRGLESYCYFELITYLLSHGAQISAVNDTGVRVLIDAGESKDPRVIEALCRIEELRDIEDKCLAHFESSNLSKF